MLCRLPYGEIGKLFRNFKNILMDFFLLKPLYFNENFQSKNEKLDIYFLLNEISNK